MSAQDGQPAGSLPHANPISVIRFRSQVLTAGTFDVHPSHPRFESAGHMAGPTIVFPKNGVWIQHEHEPPFVADANTVTYYNGGERFIRRQLAKEGDHCHWFEFAAPVAVEILSRFDPAALERRRTFAFTHGPSDTFSYLLQRQAMEHLRRAAQPDSLYVEEAILRVFDRVVSAGHKRQSLRHGVSGRRAKWPVIAEKTREVLAVRFAENISLSDVAGAVGTSMYHLCRVFKARTGRTIHDYRNELRLRRALTRLPETRDLTGLALDLGFSSHSHLTLAFRRKFQMTPSEVRRNASSKLIREMVATLALHPQPFR